jgi:hypothetical protein
MMLKNKKSNPWFSLLNTFLFIIILGAFLLMLPNVHKGTSLGFVDALFTSTSAVCVTGLVVTNTSNFNLSGQIIILFLIQIGAIGIMTLSSSLLLFLRGELDLHKRTLFAKLNDSFSLHSARDILSFILKFTFFTEAIGVLFLFFGFMLQGFSVKHSIYSAVFHSISAFCNAGFSIYDSSMIDMNPLIKVTIIPRGKALGAAWYLPEERQITTKEQILDEMCATLGGRASEEVNFGKISTGALNDLEKVTKQAQACVMYYGLNKKIGNLSYYDSSGQSEYNFTKPYSDKTAQTIDEEVRKLAEDAYQRALKILGDNIEQLKNLAQRLLDEEVIFAEDVESVFGPRPFGDSDKHAHAKSISSDFKEKKDDEAKESLLKKENDKKLAEAETQKIEGKAEEVKEEVNTDETQKTEA